MRCSVVMASHFVFAGNSPEKPEFNESKRVIGMLSSWVWVGVNRKIVKHV
jgi:hypothetical protein